MNEDLEQMRKLHARLSRHQFLAMDCVTAADAFRAALFSNRNMDITEMDRAYREKRAALEAAMTERDIDY
jgi:glutathione S-transferase